MLKKMYVVALWSFSTLGLVSFPAQAQQASTEVTNQNATITGNNNVINQVINQVTVQQQPVPLRESDRLDDRQQGNQHQGHHYQGDRRDHDQKNHHRGHRYSRSGHAGHKNN